MIPKILHYIHFGGEETLSDFRKTICLPSIYKYCVDWEIKIWNEHNLDMEMNNWVKQAYENKQYNYLSDYFRIFLLYKYGGVYIDTDVEIIRPIDNLLCNKAFCGIQQDQIYFNYFNKNLKKICIKYVDYHPIIALGLIIGCEPGDNYIKQILDNFSNYKNCNSDPLMVYPNKLFHKDGFVFENKLQRINDWVIYPAEYFCPIPCGSDKLNKTVNTYTIHHYGK